MIKHLFFLVACFLMHLSLATSYLEALIDLEDLQQEFVLETKRINIPGYPHAFNPTIIRYQGSLLLGFRDIPDPKVPFNSVLGVMWLDENFNPASQPQLLNTRQFGDLVPSRAEDARLLLVGDDLYAVYSDNSESKISKGGFRVYLAKVVLKDQLFTLENIECLSHFEGESQQRREKNWVPFDYKGHLLLAYSLQPHLIFRPVLGKGKCEKFSLTNNEIEWNWGDLRGGTPGIIDGDHYLSFFHTCKQMESVQSGGRNILHYFMGAYTFASKPPFEILSSSHEPIFAKGFYQGKIYKPYWHPIQAIFPCGFVFDENYIWVVYGRQDHESWVVKLDKSKLLQSLLPVKTIK